MNTAHETTFTPLTLEPRPEVASSITELVGHTPLLHARAFSQAAGVPDNVKLLTKLEFFEPSSSVKDRAALNIILAAQESGDLKPGGTIVEATSGNMGIGLATMAAALGYKMIAVMPESMSIERRKLMAQLGVELELTSRAGGMKEAVARADEIVKATPNTIAAHQFENIANARAHEFGTAPEIYNATKGKLTHFVAGVGTGGTLMGVTRALRPHLPELKAIAVEPVESAVLSGEGPNPHGIQGIGAGFVPGLIDRDAIDEIKKIDTSKAIATSQLFAKTEGALVGISAGAALAAAVEVAKEAPAGSTVVVVVPDTGERYLSTPLFGEQA